MDTLERFYTHVDRNGPVPAGWSTPCHLWTASCFPSGYGQFKAERRNHRAHRWLWQHLRGALAVTEVLDHLACDTPRCVNLDHLRVTTHRGNLLRSSKTHAARNAAKTHCPSGHPYDGTNTYVRPSDGARCCRACLAAAARRRRLNNTGAVG